MKKSTKKIISFILAGTMAATVSGCSRNTNKDIKGVTIESSTAFSCGNMRPIDYCLDSFHKSYKENEKDVKYEYLIDYNNTSDDRIDATLGKIVREMHISKLIDKGYSSYTIATFTNGTYSITLPDVYKVYISPNYLKKIFANDVKFDLYKIHTLDGSDLYYFKEQIEIGGYIKKINEVRNSTLFDKDEDGNIVAEYIMSDKIDHVEYCGKFLCSKDGSSASGSSDKDELINIDVYNVPYLKKGDVMACETLFKYNDKNEIEIIAKKQSGVGADRPNVARENVGNMDEAIQNLDKTLFSSLSEKTNSESYILEALDTYSGLDNYLSSENDGKDFEMFKKR